MILIITIINSLIHFFTLIKEHTEKKVSKGNYKLFFDAKKYLGF